MTAACIRRSVVCGLGLLSLLASGAGAQSCALSVLDRPVTAVVRRPALTSNRVVHATVDAIALVGGYGPFVASPAMFSVGRTWNSSRLESMGRNGMRTLLLTSVATGGLKFALGRARPSVSADSNACDFRLGRGFRRDEYRSMPSGHTSAAFAFAAAISRTERSAAVPLYTGATLVGLARIYQDKHWASDVLLGAAIGILAGNLVVRN